MKQIRIGSVSIPLDSYAIGGTALLGIRDSGKTFATKGIAEQLMDHGIPLVIFDAIGVWRFLKTPGQGPNARGYEIVVAGGNEPDLPLNPQSAPEIVRAAIRENISVVFDLYDRKLSKADWRRIVQACFRTLLYENEGVRHIILEESAEFIPQKVMDGETYAEVEKVVRMGGNRSLGVTLINQRAQEVNKAVLDLCENLVLMKQRGSHAIDSLERWMDRLSPDQAKAIARELPSLKAGECWVFPGSSDTPTRTKTHLIRSFHPDRRKPQLTAKVKSSTVDTSQFIARMNDALPRIAEEAKANDPAELKKRVRELERQVAHKSAGPAGATPEELAAAEQGGYERGRALAVEAQKALLAKLRFEFEDAESAFSARFLSALKDAAPQLPMKVIHSALAKPVRQHLESLARQQVAARPTTRSDRLKSNTNGELLRPQQKILDKLAWLESKGITPAPKETLAAVCDVSPTSGGYFNNLGKLRSAGLIDYPQGGTVAFTDAGRAAANEPTDDGRDVHEHWLEIVSEPQRKILAALIDAHPDPLEKDALAELINVSPTSGGYFNNLGRLRTLGAIDYPTPGKAALTKYVMPE